MDCRSSSKFRMGVSLFLIILIIVTSINLLTEVTSNMATTAMLLPVLVTIALAIEIHPYFLLVSATLAASCAFMLPISTPPNAVVFSSGFLKIEDMFKKGNLDEYNFNHYNNPCGLLHSSLCF